MKGAVLLGRPFYIGRSGLAAVMPNGGHTSVDVGNAAPVRSKDAGLLTIRSERGLEHFLLGRDIGVDQREQGIELL